MSDGFDSYASEEEKVEDLLHGKLKILQKEKGYRFSVDPLLLADFVRVAPEDKVIDLGTGSGVLPLILAERTQAKSITGVEIQPEMADMASRSVKMNKLGRKIKIIEADLKKLAEQFKAESFDVVLSNPPYIPMGAGKLNPQKDKAIARHEVAVQLDDVVTSAKYLVKEKGAFYLVYPAARFVDLVVSMRNHNLEPKEVQFVHSNENSAAKLVLVKAVRGGGTEMKVGAPLYIYNLEGDYTDEASKILENGKNNTPKP
jgi:tRNA1(Val) A37 N6-methylase TrmN6